jgi:lipopolysaccharide export LptBFGC system permease protein LptF
MATQNHSKVGFFDKLTEIRKWAILALFGLVLFFGYKFFTSKNDSSSLESSTNLIQQQILNVGKLVVTEGHFAEVLTYKDKDEYLGGMVSFDKKALLVVNADVTVAYDLHLIKYDIDEKTKTITILNIPKEEIKIAPDIKFYDVDQSKLNPFTGDDYNKISVSAKASIAKKIETSSLKSNAQNRLISELSKMLILTNSMGWKLQYQGNTINKETDFKL